MSTATLASQRRARFEPDRHHDRRPRRRPLDRDRDQLAAAPGCRTCAFDAPGITMVDNQIVVEPPDGDNCEIC